MLGADHPVGGEQAVLDIGEHGVGPAESGMARGGAIGTGDVALMDDARLLGNAAKPLAAVADDSRSGRDTAQRRLVSPAWKPRTTWRRVCSGRPSAEGKPPRNTAAARGCSVALQSRAVWQVGFLVRL